MGTCTRIFCGCFHVSWETCAFSSAPSFWVDQHISHFVLMGAQMCPVHPTVLSASSPPMRRRLLERSGTPAKGLQRQRDGEATGNRPVRRRRSDWEPSCQETEQRSGISFQLLATNHQLPPTNYFAACGRKTPIFAAFDGLKTRTRYVMLLLIKNIRSTLTHTHPERSFDHVGRNKRTQAGAAVIIPGA